VRGAHLDRFSFFFTFYALMLGLAVTELLSGVARLVRARIQRIEPQTALLALLTFMIIVATWIDAFDSLRTVTIDLGGLWAPILLATCYYLAASVVFPSDPADFDDLDSYFHSRKRFVVLMLVLAEVFVTFTYRDVFAFLWANRPAEIFIWMIPYKLAIFAAFAALYVAQTRRANVIVLALSLLLFTLPNWHYGFIRHAIAAHWGYQID
jgi:hypothetical protein